MEHQLRLTMGSDDIWRLKIREMRSGLDMEFELNPIQLSCLLGGLAATVDGTVPSHMGDWGRYEDWFTHYVDMSDAVGLNADMAKRWADGQAEKVLLDLRDEDETWRRGPGHRTNSLKMAYRFYRYVDKPTNKES